MAGARRANEVNPPGAPGRVNEAAGLADLPGGGNLALQGFGSAPGAKGVPMGASGVLPDARQIDRMPTVTAFVGASGEGPAGEAVLVTSQAAFEAGFGASGDLALAVSHYFLNGGPDAWMMRTGPALGSPDWDAAFAALDAVKGLSLLVLPAEADPVVQARALAYAEERRAFVIFDPPPAVVDAATAKAWLEGAPALRRPNAAAYLPRLLVDGDPSPRAFAGSGAVAGVIVRTDLARGVWKAPAGREASIAGARGLASQPDGGEIARLTALGINALRSLPTHTTVVWGARTLAGADGGGSEWKYVNVRRLALMIERSVRAGTEWAVFEPNAEPLWAAVRQSVGAFLHGLFRDGAFQGATPRDAYFVKCDRTTMTQADVNSGRLIGEIGIAPVKPAEFIILRFGHKLGGGEDTTN